MPELSIIIVSWNCRHWLHDCLDSIQAQPQGFPFETIVVDNASEDGSQEMVRREFSRVRLIVNEANVGFAAASNRGAGSAAGRFLIFLNPDTLVQPGTLAGALDFMERHPEAGIMGCRTLNPDGSLQASAFAFPTPLRAFALVTGLNRFFKLSHFTDHSALCTPDYVQGSFLMIGKKRFDDCGRFDDRFFLYAEEVDLCLRVRAAGFKTYYFPGVAIMHRGGGSSRGSLDTLSHHVQSLNLLYRKHRPPADEEKMRRALKSALLARIVLEAVFSPRTFKTSKERLKRMRLGLSPANGANAPDP
jgi:GT2 family glycosyltransferase